MPRALLATSLLTPQTFDVPAKTLFARDLLAERPNSWGRRLYEAHLRAWNGFVEDEPQKNSLEDFVLDFRLILFAMRDRAFDWGRSPIPTIGGRMANGRHRLAAALALEQDVKILETPETTSDCDWTLLKSRGLAETYSDAMAIEYCRLKPNTRLATVFSSHMLDGISDRLQEVFYVKKFLLAGPGPVNLIKEIYHGESWVPTSAEWKAKQCYPQGHGWLTVFGWDVAHPERVVDIKEQIRHIVGHHGIHINDTHVETMRLARALFNDNGVHFLNHANPKSLPPRLTEDNPEISLDSGAVLAAYGLRTTRDLDFVNDRGHLEFQGVPLEELIYDPSNYFWSRGVKYASLAVVRRMKTNRGEAKDHADLELIASVL